MINCEDMELTCLELLGVEGESLQGQGLLAAARDKYLQLLQSAEHLEHHSNIEKESAATVINILGAVGCHFNSLQALQEACKCFSVALTLARTYSLGDIPSVPHTFQALIHTHLHLGEFDEAMGAVSLYQSLLSGDPNLELELARTLLAVGQSQVDNSLCSSAMDTLQEAYKYFMLLDTQANAHDIAKTLSALGYCYLCGHDSRARGCLEEALKVWSSVHWAPEEATVIINTIKHCIEAQLRAQCFDEDSELCQELMNLHRQLQGYGVGMHIADAFTYLGTVAFHKENERKATGYFQQSLILYKQAPPADENKEEICKLLRFIGVACYNSRDFHKAARCYLECLQLLEQTWPLNTAKIGQVAECCASLGFTYSRLRDFDNMLRYYEKALERESRLAAEDLQLIETNIGSLYHVRAVKHELEGQDTQANRYYSLAETAFNKALRYSWKSFPYINYGYYLLCRANYSQAASILQQGYVNGVIDKDTVEFDHTEDPILIEDLRKELEGREDIRTPATVISLYLKTLAQARMGNSVGAHHTAGQLHQEVTTCRFDSYYVEGYGEERMKALSYSLLGYSFEAINCPSQALSAFQVAVSTLPGYSVAQRNAQRLSAHISSSRQSKHKHFTL